MPASLASCARTRSRPERRSHGVALLGAVAAAGRRPRPFARRTSRRGRRLAARLPRQHPDRRRRLIFLARRLVESRAPGRRRVPDLVGALCFAIATAALVARSGQGRGVGLDQRAERSPRFGAGARARGFCFVVALRPAPLAPVVDPTADQDPRASAAANAMTVVAAAGFYGYTLCERPLPDRGLGLLACSRPASRSRPGPFVAAAVARGRPAASPSGSAIARCSSRARLIWGAGDPVAGARRVGTDAGLRRASGSPASSCSGIGAGTTFP